VQEAILVGAKWTSKRWCVGECRDAHRRSRERDTTTRWTIPIDF
jgi:hypothetical protein